MHAHPQLFFTQRSCPVGEPEQKNLRRPISVGSAMRRSTLIAFQSKRGWKGAIFNAWMRVVMTMNFEASACEVERLTDKLGKKNSSIWNQTKEELVEIARRELGMTVTLASNETVLTLRELIRRNREMYKANADPLSKAPKGLGNMNKEALLEEAKKRGLPTEGTQTRPSLMLLIRDDLRMRSTLNSMNTPAEPSTSIAATRSEVDSEWSVIQEAAHNCHRAEVAANARADELMEEIYAQRRKVHAQRKQENNTHHSQKYWNHDHSH